MKFRFGISLLTMLITVLFAIDPYGVLDTQGEGLGRGCRTFKFEDAFPHTPLTAIEKESGIRAVAVDLNVNPKKPFVWGKPTLTTEISLLTCRDEYTVGLFNIFALNDIATLQLNVSDLQGENATIPTTA